MLGARVPASWPPEYLDAPALEWTARWLADPANDPSFGMYWLVLREPERVLIGVAGFTGMPRDGGVELGYGVVSEFRRRGLATEATRALIDYAFSRDDVRCVFAQTLSGLAPSIGVMEKCGFQFIGDGSEPGVIRYRLDRPH